MSFDLPSQCVWVSNRLVVVIAHAPMELSQTIILNPRQLA